MTKISSKYKRIIAYGCSFTAGDELADHIVIDTLSIDELDKIKRRYGNKNILKFREKYYTSEFISNEEWFYEHGEFKHGQKIDLELSMAWPRWFAEINDIDFVNRAWSGSSLEYCIYRYEEDLLLGKINHQEDLIVFSITSPARWHYFDNDGNPQRCLYGYSSAGWPSEKFYNIFVEQTFNYHQMYWDYFFHLKYIQLLNKVHGNIFGAFAFGYNMSKSHILPDHKSFISGMVEQIDTFDYIIKDLPDLYANPEKHPEHAHGFWHPKIEYHKYYAKRLSEEIEKRL